MTTWGIETLAFLFVLPCVSHFEEGKRPPRPSWCLFKSNVLVVHALGAIHLTWLYHLSYMSCFNLKQNVNRKKNPLLLMSEYSFTYTSQEQQENQQRRGSCGKRHDLTCTWSSSVSNLKKMKDYK